MNEPSARIENNRKPVASPRPGGIRSDDSRTEPLYANFCRVVALPEELVVDFGVNLEPFGIPVVPIRVSRRIVANFFTAKRLAEALAMAPQRHESLFGVLETDVVQRGQPRALNARFLEFDPHTGSIIAGRKRSLTWCPHGAFSGGCGAKIPAAGRRCPHNPLRGAGVPSHRSMARPPEPEQLQAAIAGEKPAKAGTPAVAAHGKKWLSRRWPAAAK